MARPLTATCECGKCSVTQRRPGGMVMWKCHCSHCRASNEKDALSKGEYSFNSADWCCNVSLKGPTKSKCTTYAPFGCPCPIWCADRRTCSECGSPLIYYGHGAFTGVVIVNMERMQREMPQGCTLQPRFENFYDSGLKKGQLAPKTYYGDVMSTLGLAFEIVCCGAPFYGFGHCCCLGWGEPAAVAAE